jgi:chromosome segregation ATPase
MRRKLIVTLMLAAAALGCTLIQGAKPTGVARVDPGQAPATPPPASGESLADRYSRSAGRLHDLREAGLRASPYLVGRLDVLLDQLAAARDARQEGPFAGIEETLDAQLDTLKEEIASGAAATERDAGEPSRQVWETRIRSLSEDLERCRQKNEAQGKALAQADLTVRELTSQLEDAQAAAGEIIENVRKYSTKQVAAMHAEAKVMLQRMEGTKTSEAARLSAYARAHFREGESQLKNGNSAGAAFYFSQISGIYSRFQKLHQK